MRVVDVDKPKLLSDEMEQQPVISHHLGRVHSARPGESVTAHHLHAEREDSFLYSCLGWKRSTYVCKNGSSTEKAAKLSRVRVHRADWCRITAAAKLTPWRARRAVRVEAPTGAGSVFIAQSPSTSLFLPRSFHTCRRRCASQAELAVIQACPGRRRRQTDGHRPN